MVNDPTETRNESHPILSLKLDTATYQLRGNVVESYQRPNDNH